MQRKNRKFRKIHLLLEKIKELDIWKIFCYSFYKYRQSWLKLIIIRFRLYLKNNDFILQSYNESVKIY